MTDHVVAIVQARLGSRRFPRKVLQDIAGKPMVLHVLERAAAIPGVHTTVAAVPDDDRELADVITHAGYPVVTGPEHDVLTRYLLAARSASADVIVRLTADCPLVPPEVGGALVKATLTDHAAFYTSCCALDGPGTIDGFDIEVFRRWILETADRESEEREHITMWMRRLIRLRSSGSALLNLKLSVDTTDDLILVRRIMAELPPRQWSINATLLAAARSGVWDFPTEEARE